MSAQPLLPNEFLWAVTEPQYADDDPRQFAAAVADAQARRHPDVLGLQPDGFAIPMATALFLYRREPKNYRDVVLSALYVPTSTTFWERIAAAARDAWAAQDWSLLGRLAYRFEIGVTRCACTGWDGLTKEPIADHLAKPENARVAVQPVQLALVRTAFLQAFDFQHGVIPAAGYVRAALAYWAELPLISCCRPVVAWAAMCRPSETGRY